MDLIVLFEKFWPIILSLLALVVWSVRLEGKVSFADQEIKELKIKHDSLDSQLVNKISAIEKSLAKIEGWLQGKYGKEE